MMNTLRHIMCPGRVAAWALCDVGWRKSAGSAYALAIASVALCGVMLMGCNDRRSRRRLRREMTPESRKLFGAASEDDVAAAREALQEGADIDAVDSHGHWTALGLAADSGSMSVARFLIDRGADVNKECPLYYAAQKGRTEMARMLLAAGADPNEYRIEKVPTPPLAAARGGYLETLRLLMNHGAVLGPQEGAGIIHPFTAAAYYGHADVVAYLLSKGCRVDITDSDGRTVLHLAALGGDTETVKLLLAAGADPRHKSKQGLTPADIAQQQGNSEAAALLRSAARGA